MHNDDTKIGQKRAQSHNTEAIPIDNYHFQTTLIFAGHYL